MEVETIASLPPGVAGKVYGTITVEVGTVVWDTPPNRDLILRVLFFGEDRGTVVRLEDTGARVARYAIRSTEELFGKYLRDMRQLHLEVAEGDAARVVGKVVVDFDPFLTEKARDLDVRGTFPILAHPKKSTKLGDIDISIKAEFAPSKTNSTPRNLLSTFQQSEQKHPSDHSSPSADEQLVFLLNPRRDEEFPTAHFPGAAETVKVPKSALKRIDRPAVKLPFPASDPPSSEPTPTAKRDTSPSVVNLPAAHRSPLPAIKHLKLVVTTLTVLDPASVKDRTLNLEVLLPSPTLEPGVTTQQVAQNKYLPANVISVHCDTIRITHKGGVLNVYDFKHESLHRVEIDEAAVGAMANQPIRFKLMVGVGRGKEEESARADVMWESLLTAPGFVYPAALDLMPSALADMKKQRKTAYSVRNSAIGQLMVRFELLPEKIYEPVVMPEVRPVAEKERTEQKAFDSARKNEASVPLPTISENSEILSMRTYQLYLFVESAAQLEPRADSTARCPFIRYKPFLETEFLTTPVLWDWKEAMRFDHTLAVPIAPTDKLISRMKASRLTLEVWDKKSANENELLGLVPLQLSIFADALERNTVGLPGSVYPLIGVDEYRAVTSPAKQRDVGYVRVCLALGSQNQIQRLMERHTPPKPKKEEPAPRRKTEEAGTSTADIPVVTRTASPPKITARMSDSVESIGDIAALLNRKDRPDDSPREQSPPSADVKPTLREELVVDPPPPNGEQIRAELLQRILYEKIDLDGELREIDEFKRGFIHCESFASLLEELRLGFTRAEILVLVDYIVSKSEKSTTRRLLHSDILAALELTPRRALNTRHRFDVSFTEFTSCKVINMLPEKSVYIRYQFPIDTTTCESPLLPKSEDQPLSLSSTHCCTVTEGHDLSSCIPSTVPGLTVWLCRNQERSETQILGKAVLSSEEFLDLAKDGGRMSRVLCLYADHNRTINSFHSEIIGKLRCVVRYSQDKTSDAPGVSTTADRHTIVETLISRESTLTAFVTAARDLDRGFKYYRDTRGLVLDSRLHTYAKVSLFHEMTDERDMDITEFRTKTVPWSTDIDFSQRFQAELRLSEAALAYIQTKTALVELVVVYAEDEEMVFGTANVCLLPLLLNSIKGEFALMNDYGQYMGCILLALSLNKDDVRADSGLYAEKPKSAIPPMPESATGNVRDSASSEESVPLRFAAPRDDPISKLIITLESGMRIATPTSGVLPNPYAKLMWKGEEIATSPPAGRSTNPVWAFSHSLPLYAADLKSIHTSPLILALFHRPPGGSEEELLGKAEIALSPLLHPGGNGDISGWYHILLREAPAGQVKIRISPSISLSDLSTVTPPLPSLYQRSIDTKLRDMEDTLNSTHDQDLFALHTQKMRDLDSMTAQLNMKFGSADETAVRGRAFRYADVHKGSTPHTDEALNSIQEVSEHSSFR